MAQILIYILIMKKDFALNPNQIKSSRGKYLFLYITFFWPRLIFCNGSPHSLLCWNFLILCIPLPPPPKCENQDEPILFPAAGQPNFSSTINIVLNPHYLNSVCTCKLYECTESHSHTR